MSVTSSSQRWRVSGSRAYELSPDLRDKQVEMLCRKYGGAPLADRAARLVQHAYRRYRLRRSFARMRLEAAAASPARRLSRGLAGGGGGLAVGVAAVGETAVVGGGVRCRVRARDAVSIDCRGDVGGLVDVVRQRRRVVAVHSVSVSSTTTTTQQHHHRVLVRSRCCATPGDTSSVASSDAGAARRRRAPAGVDGTRSDDELLSTGVPRRTVVDAARTESNVEDVDYLTDADEGPVVGDATTSTFQQLCLTDSSYGEMTVVEADTDNEDDDPRRPHYVDGDTLDVEPPGRSAVIGKSPPLVVPNVEKYFTF